MRLRETASLRPRTADLRTLAGVLQSVILDVALLRLR